MVSVRRAIPSDHPWIAAMLVSGAREGHFSSMIGQQASRMLSDVAARGGITLMKARNGRVEPRTVRVDVWVAETSGAPAAFLLCMEDVDGYELNLGGTRPEFRRRQCFDALVDHASHNANIRPLLQSVGGCNGCAPTPWVCPHHAGRSRRTDLAAVLARDDPCCQ
jgi:hypothetical protein